MTKYDTIVIGLGAMGSATALELARRGKRVLGIEQFKGGGHRRGSSHGESRIYRQAYYEGSTYVPMLLRAETRWRELEEESGCTLLEQCGGLFMGREDSALIRGSLDSCRVHDLSHERLEASDIRQRFPLFHPPEDFVGLYESAAGFVHPERAVASCQELAAQLGAELHFKESVLRIEAEGPLIVHGDQAYEADQVIVTAGPWTGTLMGPLAPHCVVQRVPLHWFRAVGAWQDFTSDRYPAHAWEFPDGRLLYGPPVVDGRIKLAFHHPFPSCDPDQVDRKIKPEEVEAMCAAAESVMPGVCAEHDSSNTCLYTMSPDEHFIIDRNPDDDRILFAAGFSGHGFKFMPVIGEVLADLALNGESDFDLSMFRLDRFQEA